MNSAQRRRVRREFPHVVRVSPRPGDRYFQHDNRVDNARTWCRQQCKGTWTVWDNWNYAYFKFANERDAIYFALKWA